MGAYDTIFDQAAKQYGVDPALLRAVSVVESGTNPNVQDSSTGAQGMMQFMPATARSLGVTNPKDPGQAIPAAARLLRENLDATNGDERLALMMYHGGTDQSQWGEKTQGYPSKVYSAMARDTQQRIAASDPMARFLASGGEDMGGQVASGHAAPPSAASGGDALSRFLASGGEDGHSTTQDATAPDGGIFTPMPATEAWKKAKEQTRIGAPPAEPSDLAQQRLAAMKAQTGFSNPLSEAVPAMVTGLGANIIGGWRGLATLATGGTADDAANNVHNELTSRIYQPETQQGKEAVSRLGSNYNPMNWPGLVADYAGGKVTDITGSPALGAAVNTGINAIPLALMGRGGGSAVTNPMVAATVPESALFGPSRAMLADAPANDLLRAMAGQKAANEPAPVASNPIQGAINKAQQQSSGNPIEDAIKSGRSESEKTNAGNQQEKVQVGTAPQAEAIRPEDMGVSIPENSSMSPKGPLPAEAQLARMDVMNRIGLTSQRPSAISGDRFTAGQEYQHSRLDTPQGEVIRNQLGKEQDALKNYATNLVQQTGSVADTPEAMGQAIRQPLQALSEHYDSKISDLYKQADEKAAGAPVGELSGLGKLLDTNSMFAGKSENASLRRGVRAYMKEQGMVDKEGNLQPVTAEAAEGLRQYLNGQWSPQTSGLIGKIKEAIDGDVLSGAGEDIYKQARALHAERKATLDNPNGISALLNEEGPGGINQKIPDERVPSRLMSMPTAQFEHIINTLKGAPDHIQTQAQASLAEIKGALAREIYKAGDSGGTKDGPSLWNAAKVSKAIDANRSKLSLVFSPEELEQFKTLDSAGHILQTPSAYPGAAVQGHNLAQRGMIWAPKAIGTGVGGALGGAPGALLGSALGDALSAKMARKVDVANANKLLQALNNPKPIVK